MELKAGKITLSTNALKRRAYTDATVHAALLSAFNLSDFDRMIKAVWGISIETITTSNGFSEQLWDVLNHFSENNWINELIVEAKRQRPSHKEIQNL